MSIVQICLIYRFAVTVLSWLALLARVKANSQAVKDQVGDSDGVWQILNAAGINPAPRQNDPGWTEFLRSQR